MAKEGGAEGSTQGGKPSGDTLVVHLHPRGPMWVHVDIAADNDRLRVTKLANFSNSYMYNTSNDR